jgi:Na+/H+-dicarboxylate symporter
MGDQDDTKKMIDRLLSGLVFCGWILLILSVILTTTILLGLADVHEFSVRGTSGIRSVAAIAVLGCLSAAIGYMTEE